MQLPSDASTKKNSTRTFLKQINTFVVCAPSSSDENRFGNSSLAGCFYLDCSVVLLFHLPSDNVQRNTTCHTILSSYGRCQHTTKMLVLVHVEIFFQQSCVQQ